MSMNYRRYSPENYLRARLAGLNIATYLQNPNVNADYSFTLDTD
jgi:hypothetical protein